MPSKLLHVYRMLSAAVRENVCVSASIREKERASVHLSLTCPSSMSPLRMPGGLSSVLLVRLIDKLWALRFCLG